MVEDIVLSNLVNNEEYARKVIAFLKPEYFTDNVHRTVFNAVREHIAKYNSRPSQQALKVEVGTTPGLNESTYLEVSEYVDRMEHDPSTDLQWLLDTSERFCQDKAIYNALMESVRIVDEEGRGNISRGAIPKLLSDAVAVSFDASVGHDYFEDADERYDFYHIKEEKVPFDLHYLNEITKGGVSKKTLNLVMSSTGVGKSMVMCHMAASNLVRGKNVLYITLEMAEERISERIDVNLLDVTFDELSILSKAQFKARVEKVRERTPGKLVVVEYPPTVASVMTFRALLDDLRLKKNFVPDIIYVDYLNLMASSRIKMGTNFSSYTYIKSVAEELRGLAVENNLPIFSATQTNRGGFDNSDIDLNDVSESFGLPMTVDFMVALISDEELEKAGQILVKQLKNRYDDMNKLRRFIIGVNKAKMKLFDTEDTAQEDIMGGPFDSSDFGGKYNERYERGAFDDFN